MSLKNLNAIILHDVLYIKKYAMNVLHLIQAKRCDK